MNNIDLEKSKDSFKTVKVPEDLSLTIEAGKKEAMKKRKINRKAPLGVAAAVFLSFVILINTSVAVAEAVNDIPILKNIADILLVNEGIKYALKEGYIQEINKSVEKDGIKVTITRVIGDYSKLIIGYKVEGDSINQDNFYGFEGINVSTVNGELVGGLVSYGSEDFKNDGLKPLKGERYITIENLLVRNLPKELQINFNQVLNKDTIPGSEEEKILEGRFSIPIELNDKIIKVSPETYVLNKEIQVGDYRLFIKEMKVYPMSTELIIRNDIGNNMNFGWFDNCYIEDERGRAFGLSAGTSGLESEDYTLTFNGGAYGKSKELTLYTKGMYYDPAEKRKIVVDLKSKTLVAGGEYGIELVGVRNYREYKAEDHYIGEGYAFQEEWSDEDNTEISKENKDKLIYEGLGITFKSLPEFGIKSLSFSHSDANRYSSSSIGEETVVSEATIFFDKTEIPEGIIEINLDHVHGEKNKTSPFSVKLK